MYTCPFPLEPSPPSPHPTPPGDHRALTLGSLHHTGNSHWLPTLHMVIVHVSVLFSHVIPHSPSPTVSKMCFLCCPARGITSTLFLDSIYMHYYTLCAMTASNACILGLNGSMELPCSRLCSCLLLRVLPFALCASQVYVLLGNYSKVNYRLYKPHV